MDIVYVSSIEQVLGDFELIVGKTPQNWLPWTETYDFRWLLNDAQISIHIEIVHKMRASLKCHSTLVKLFQMPWTVWTD